MLDIPHCTGCTACASSCVRNAITMTANEEGFLVPVIQTDRCIQCHVCEEVCPLNRAAPAEVPIRAYAAKSKDRSLQAVSSSGGLFSELAGKIIAEGGVVFGVRLDSNFHAVHSAAQTLEELEAFRGSKYVQSDVGDSFGRVRAFLEAGRLVLFSGTPCQVAGLKRCLRKDYENLITADFVCHGVPSPMIWDQYVRTKAEGRKLRRISFRDKTHGWNNYSLSYELENGRRELENRAYSPYLRGFNLNLFLRPSCYACHFKGINRVSDLTLADCWGIETIAPDFADPKGVSTVLIQSPRGQALFQSLPNIVYREVNLDAVGKANRSIVISASENLHRGAFFEKARQEGVVKAMAEFCSVSRKERLLLSMKQIYHMIKGV